MPPDVLFDVVGASCIAAALWLHLWATEHAPADRGAAMPPAIGPYQHMRHPRQVVYVLIGAGLAVLAESALALIFVPAILITVYRVVAHVEEGRLAERYGAAYAEHCARVALVPWPTMALLRDAASACPWRVIPQERRFVLLTLVLAALADLNDMVLLALAWRRLQPNPAPTSHRAGSGVRKATVHEGTAGTSCQK